MSRTVQTLERQTFLNSHRLVVKSWKGFSREERGVAVEQN